MTMPFDDEPYSKWSLEYWQAAIVFFWKDWRASRPGGFWYLLGTCITIALLFIVLIIIPKAMRESTRQAYERRWVAAEKDEKWDQADIWVQRMIALGDSRPAIRYAQAMIAEKLGRTAHAEAIVRQIAAGNDFPPAHAWLASRTLDADATPEEVKQAIVHLKAAIQINSEDEKLHLSLADAYRRSGQLKEAANEIYFLTRKHPEYYLPLAKIYAEIGESAGAKEYAALAEKFLKDKSQRNPDKEELVEPVIDSLLLQAKWQEAQDYASRRIVDEERARKLKSRIHTAASDALMKDPATQLEAVRHLYKALEANPKNRVALLKLARLAPQIIQISPPDVEPIRKWLTLAQESAPDDVELAALLGMLHMQPGGDLEKAEKLLEKASTQQSILLLDVAQIQERLKKLEARDATLKKAIERLSSNADGKSEAQTFALSEALARIGQFKDAEKVLTDALAKNTSPLLRSALSQLYSRQAELKTDDLSAKVRLHLEAIKASRTHIPSEAALADLVSSKPELREQVVSGAAELISTGKANRGGHMLLGVIASRENNWNESIFHFEQALSQEPGDPALQNNLAWALAKRNGPGDAKRSLELAELAVSRAPLNADLRETRGQAWLVNRQWSHAISDFEFSLNAFPERKALHLLLADAYRGLGNNTLAEKHAELAK